jgi:hypothetical protein
VEDLLHHAKAAFLPDRLKETLENLESASGTVEGQAGFKVVSSVETPEVTVADLHIREGTLKQNTGLLCPQRRSPQDRARIVGVRVMGCVFFRRGRGLFHKRAEY